MEPWINRYKLSLALPNNMAAQLRELAHKEHRTLTGQIIYMLKTALEKESSDGTVKPTR